MPITITSAEINPILHCNRPLSPDTQCRIGLTSAEVIVIGIISPMPLFPSLCSQSYLLIFSQKVFALVPNGVPAIAAALDPRHHHLNFFSAEEHSQVHDIISSKLEQLHSDSESTQEPQAKKRKEDSKDSAMTFLLGTSCESTSTLKWRNEILQFQREPQMHHDSNPLNWWKVNESRFPTLAKMARCYVSVPATLVPSERVFSTAGLVINDYIRSGLSPENVDMLIFLSKNLRMIKSVDLD